jgi:cellulose biosynthesis protein BcsQ
LRLHFGVPLQETGGFTRLLAQRPDWRGCLRETSAGIPLLMYGASGMGDAIALAAAATQTPALLQRPVKEILAGSDICLVVDTPPGPSPLLAALLPLTDLLVTVLLVDATSISLIPMLEHGARQAEPARPPMGFVLNQFDPRTRLGGVIADAATRHLGERLLGMIYRDEQVAEAVAAQKLLADYAPSSKANQDITSISRAILARLRLPSGATHTQRRGAHA